MTVLTREEKETIICFDETTADATIFTFNKAWQHHLERRLGLKPTMVNGRGAKEYHIPKNRIKPPRAPKRITPATRERLREQGMARRQKSPNPPNSNTVVLNSRVIKFSEGKTTNHAHTKSKIKQKSAVRKTGGKK